MLVAVFHLGNAALLSGLTPVRIVIFAGLLRAVAGGFYHMSTRNRFDQLMLFFSLIALLSSFGHKSSYLVPYPLLERAGLILNFLGTYLYARAYLVGPEFIIRYSLVLAIIVIPFAPLLALEQTTGRNTYIMLGSKSDSASIRNDRFRAMGPFGHAILAGTAAAATLPFMFLVHSRGYVLLGRIGIGASVIATIASASSGPLAAMIVSLGLLSFWRWRHILGLAKICIGLMLIFLNFSMSRPIWFLIARIDIVGGSTGWHRSMLIDSAMNRLGEWWLAGTDYTRDWMLTGVMWNPNHTDITNYYLQMGVLGGLPLMLAFITIIVTSLAGLEKALPILCHAGDLREFDVWCVWTAILTHSISFLSVAYFDQSYAGFFMLIGAVPAICVWEVEDLHLKL